jgi:hypothetical protein
MVHNKIKLLFISSIMIRVKSNLEAINVIAHSRELEVVNSNPFELTYVHVNSTFLDISGNV